MFLGKEERSFVFAPLDQPRQHLAACLRPVQETFCGALVVATQVALTNARAALEVAQAYVEAETDQSVEMTLAARSIRTESKYTECKALKVLRQNCIHFLHGEGSIPPGRNLYLPTLVQCESNVVRVDDMADTHSPQKSRTTIRTNTYAFMVLDHIDGTLGDHFPKALPPKWNAMIEANSAWVSWSQSISASSLNFTPVVQPCANRAASTATKRKKKP